MDYSLLIVVAAGMMKMATGDDSPLRQGAGTGLDWFSMATEPCGGGTSDLGYFLEVSVFIGIFGASLTLGGGLQIVHEIGAHAHLKWARPPPSWATHKAIDALLWLQES